MMKTGRIFMILRKIVLMLTYYAFCISKTL